MENGLKKIVRRQSSEENGSLKAKRKRENVIITSGVFEIPLDDDGNLSLTNIRAQLPGASGLWYWSEDGHRKKAVKFDRSKNKLLAPEGIWADAAYNVSYSSTAGFLGEKELERYEIASRIFQQSVDSVSKLTKLDSYAVPSFADADQDRRLINANGVDNTPKEGLATSSGPWDEKEKARLAQLEQLLSEANNANRTLERQLKTKTDQISATDMKRQELEKVVEEKNKEIEELKENLEKRKQEFEFLAGPIEGFGDSRFVQEMASVKKQLDDSKWRCGELESSLTAKNREAFALHDWKREAELTINRLQSEHGSCNHRRERLEATVHALHQFALIMKKEAEMAKQRAGIDTGFNLFLNNEKKASEEVEEKIKRFEKDLDVARDNLYRQADEIENFKWKCTDLETTLNSREKEMKLIMKESFNKEKSLKGEVEHLKLEVLHLRQGDGGYPAGDDIDDESLNDMYG